MTSFGLSQILDWTHGRLCNGDQLPEQGARIQVTRMRELAGSGPKDLAFFFNKAYQADLLGAQPAILITAEPFVQPLQASGLPLFRSTAVVACEDPYGMMALLSEKFAAQLSTVSHVPQADAASHLPRIHPTAVVDSAAHVGPGVRVGPYCVVDAGAEIGAGSQLYPGCHVGPGVKVGVQCVLFSHVVLYENTVIGDRVRVHSHSTLGSDGFGYAPIADSSRPGGVKGHRKIYHLGRVVIGDDVEIGANCTIDRGTLGDTRVDREAKLDNQVHIGHNAWVEQGAILCGGICLAGNAHIGKFAYIGGMVGVTNQVHVGDGARVAACSLISKDIPDGGTGVGNPQREQREHFKIQALMNQMLKERKERKANERKPL